MKLNDTVDMMNSDDFRERFKAEYYQLAIRTEGLRVMLEKYIKDELDFEPKCSYDLLFKQFIFMNDYKNCLEERAIVEGINLDEEL